MTERLYYDHPETREFDATVLRVEPVERGTSVWLNRTAFYPTSGGQPYDTGLLGAAIVVSVEEDDHGDLTHVVRGPAPEVGSTVHGTVDWTRRFDHMQQHTGQHVLSAVVDHAFRGKTVSFHLGAESCTIDIDRELTAAQLADAELSANRVVWDDVPVAIRYATEAEARALPLRKEPARGGTLRLIDIDGVDLSACGGTHVPRTGAIGQIAVVSWERFKGGQRLEFVCGGRALARQQRMRDIVAASIRQLSVLPDDLPGAIERLQADSKDLRKALAAAQGDLARYEAVAMADGAEPIGARRAVLRVIDGDANRLKALATSMVTRGGLVVVLVSRSQPALAVAARSEDVSLSCQEIVAALVKQFSGRGGGKPDLAQCGGLQGSPDAVLDLARSYVIAHP
jgi:alanyl-tRNA synthetase